MARQALQRILDELDAGNSGCLAISGEPGIGKSWLIGELRRRAEARGGVVISGRASRIECEVPFGPVIDALGDHVAALEMQEDDAALLGQTFPRLGPSPMRDPTESGAARYRQHDAVRRAVAAVAGVRPLILVLDDLQWADEATVGLIAHLVHHPPRAAVELVLAYRPAQAPVSLLSLLSAGERNHAVTALELGPLTETETSELLGGDVGERLCATLHRDAGGNPFYLKALARAWHQSGRPHGAAGRLANGLWRPVPAAVSRAVGDELAELTARGRALMDGAAVAGDPFDIDVAAPIAGLSERDGLAALDEVAQAGLVRAGTSARCFVFRQPIVHRAVYAATAGAWRDGAHATAAAMLISGGAPATDVAHHLECSARTGDQQAISLLTRAASETAARSPWTAARWYGAALRLLPAQSDGQARIDLLASRAVALAAAGQLEDSNEVLAEVFALMTDGAGATRADLVARVARADDTHGHRARARSLLSDVVDTPMDLRSSALLGVQVAVEHWRALEPDECRAVATRARADALGAGDDLLRAQAEAMLALAAVNLVDTPTAIRHVQRAAWAIEQVPSRDLATTPEAVALVAGAQAELERIKPAAGHLRRMLYSMRAADHGIATIPALTGLARQQVWLGLLREAADTARKACDAAMRAGVDQWEMGALTILAEVALARDAIPEALDLAGRAVALSRRMPHALDAAVAGCSFAMVVAESGDPEAGRAALLDAAGGADMAHIAPAGRPYWLAMLAEIDLGLRPPDAECWVIRAEQGAARLGLPIRLAVARRARAGLSLILGDPAVAARQAQEAAAALRHADVRIEAAHAGLLAGRALARAGQLDHAASALQRARAEFAGAGAIRYVRRADDELRALPGEMVRSSYSRQRGQEGDLSTREFDVARLVADGLSNRAVAESLGVTAKTVESHLGRVYRKLGVTGRAQLAYTLARPGALVHEHH